MVVQFCVNWACVQVPLLESSSSFSSLSPSVTGKKMEHSFKSEWAGNIGVAPQFSIKEEILSSNDETQANSQKPEQAAASEYPQNFLQISDKYSGLEQKHTYVLLHV